MRLISWNVNGLRALCGKAGFHFLKEQNCDFLALQEIKAKEEQIPKDIYELGFLDIQSNSAQRAGYSGVLSALNFKTSTQKAAFWPDDEGRVLEHRFASKHGDIALFNIYFPNGQSGDLRLDYKMRFYAEFLAYLNSLKGLGIIICGDVNTAHKEIDLARPKENEKVSGFLPIERAWIDDLLSAGFIDTLRHCHGDKTDLYTWWSYRAGARARNVGWRIDYFFINDELKPYLKDAFILSEVLGSDHCPVGINIDL